MHSTRCGQLPSPLLIACELINMYNAGTCISALTFTVCSNVLRWTWTHCTVTRCSTVATILTWIRFTQASAQASIILNKAIAALWNSRQTSQLGDTLSHTPSTCMYVHMYKEIPCTAYTCSFWYPITNNNMTNTLFWTSYICGLCHKPCMQQHEW